LTHDPAADSAGVPWEGRHFEPNPAAGDDGSGDPKLVEAIHRLRAGELGEAEVVDALRDARLLIPLVAELGESGTSAGGHLVDKSQELSIVTVAGPDGRTVLPAFTSVDTMRAWDAAARPIPASAERVALAAAGEGTDLVVLDATSPTEIVIRRPALWAVARREPWRPAYLDEDVLRAFMDAAAPEPTVRAVQLAPGDPDARLAGPEVLVHFTIVDGLDRDGLDALLARMSARWAADELIVARVDSIGVRVVGAA
jgi:hypothetical protein